jgi:hypothetical protein
MRLFMWLAVSVAIAVAELSTGAVARWATPAGPSVQAQEPASSKIWIGKNAEFEEFLRTAPIESTVGTPVGILAPRHAIFAPGGLAKGAAVKKIPPGRRDGFWESYQSEIAAYKLDRLLDLNMVPPTVERRYENEPASVMLWVDNVKMLKDTQKEGLRDPNAQRWNRNLHRAQVFDDLAGNIDPNAGNWLFDAAWNFYKIDCSRCFTDTMMMPHDIKKTVRRIDRPFFDRLKALDRDTVRREMGSLLTANGALPALFRRRDAIVKAFEELAKQSGEAQVFEDWTEQ